jgi:hypothetical protein
VLCTRCREAKPVDAFARDSNRLSGRQGWCRACFTQYRQANRGRRRGQQRVWQLEKRFGITVEEFEAMLARQDGKCAICGRDPGHTLRIDHCHETGRVRGLLCLTCNAALGKLENPAWMEAATAFLAR